jgi:hypothetical protein
MPSAGFMIGFANQTIKMAEEADRQKKEEDMFLREQNMYLNKTLLPAYMTKKQKRDADSKVANTEVDYFKARGVDPDIINVVAGAGGLGSLQELRKSIETLETKKGGKPLTGEQIAQAVKVFKNNNKEGESFTDTIKNNTDYALDLETFRLDEQPPQELIDFVYGSDYTGNGSVYAMDVSGMPQGAPSSDESKLIIDLVKGKVDASLKMLKAKVQQATAAVTTGSANAEQIELSKNGPAKVGELQSALDAGDIWTVATETNPNLITNLIEESPDILSSLAIPSDIRVSAFNDLYVRGKDYTSSSTNFIVNLAEKQRAFFTEYYRTDITKEEQIQLMETFLKNGYEAFIPVKIKYDMQKKLESQQ